MLSIPVADEAVVFIVDQVGLAAQEGFGVGKKGGVVVLEDGQDVFSVLDAEVEERSFEVDGVALHGVEEAVVANKEALEETAGRDDFAFAGPDHLDVEDHGEREAHEVGHDAAMVILGDLPLLARLCLDRDRSLAALVAAAVSTGKKTRGRQRARSAAPRGCRRAPCFAGAGG